MAVPDHPLDSRPPRLTAEAITAASPRILAALRGSAQFVSEGLSVLAERPVVVKVARGPCHRNRLHGTRAGGMAIRVPVPEALEMMDGVVDDMLLLTEDEIAAATAQMVPALGITAELAAGATLAAALRYPPPGDGALLLVVTGANAEES